MSVLRLDVDTKDVDAMLDRASQPLDMRHAKKPLVAFYVARELRQFEASPWRPLSKRYAKDKAKSAPGRGILERTGALLAGLTEPEVAEFTETTGVVGVRTAGRNPLFYGRFPQTGRGEPKRTVMPRLTKEERDEMVDIIRVTVLNRVLRARP